MRRNNQSSISLYPIFWKNIKKTSIPYNVELLNMDNFSPITKSNYYLFKSTFLFKSFHHNEAIQNLELAQSLNPKNNNLEYAKEIYLFFQAGQTSHNQLFLDSASSVEEWCPRMKKLRELYIQEAHQLVINYSQAIATETLSRQEIVEFHLMRYVAFYMLNNHSDSAIALRLAFLISPTGDRVNKYLDLTLDYERDKFESNEIEEKVS